jgi:hypothetical protein
MSTLSTENLDHRLDKDVLATVRNVYVTGRDTVIKVARRDSGTYISHNQAEVKNWQKYQDPEMFAPVTDCTPDFKKIEMVKCIPLKKGRDTSLKTYYKEKMENKPYYIKDLHTENLGVLPATREVVCIDYAIMNDEYE